MRTTFTVLAAMVAGAMAWAGEEVNMHHEGSADLQRIEKLEGTWTYSSDMGEGPKEFTLTYKVASGGSAVVETMNVGTPMEMVSVYHDDHGKLAMTHYCLMGNQPYLALTASDEKSITLAMPGDRGLTDPNESHMHALKITFVDEDTVQEDWTNYLDGKENSVHSFTLKRAK